MRRLRLAWNLIKSRVRLFGAEARRQAFQEGVRHERRRVLHLLEHENLDEQAGGGEGVSGA